MKIHVIIMGKYEISSYFFDVKRELNLNSDSGSIKPYFQNLFLGKVKKIHTKIFKIQKEVH